MRTVPLVESSEPSIRTQTVTDVAVSGDPAAAIAPATLPARIAIPPMNAATSAARFLITRAHLQPQPRKNRRVALHGRTGRKAGSQNASTLVRTNVEVNDKAHHTKLEIDPISLVRVNRGRTGESWPEARSEAP